MMQIDILYGVLVFIIGLSLGWLFSQYSLRRRLIDTVEKYQVLREVLREKNGRIEILRKKIGDRDVVMGNLRSLIRNQERVISELKLLVQDRIELLRVLEKRQANSEHRLRFIESDTPQSDKLDQNIQMNGSTEDIDIDQYLQYGSRDIGNYEELPGDEEIKDEDIA